MQQSPFLGKLRDKVASHPTRLVLAGVELDKDWHRQLVLPPANHSCVLQDTAGLGYS